MDTLDRRILRALQADSARPIAVLAGDIGLSTSACHRRIKALEDAGIIAGYSARLDRTALGLSLQVFVEITLNSQALDVLEAFETAVRRYEDILECHLTSGDADYILRVVARDMEDYADIHRNCLARLPNVSSMQTIFALRPVQQFRGYPIREV
ncbi:MAG: Lrp/AsnC family transcriptional regulator [Rhodobacteraceae bacterium]|nr:Lrp/AsnC family transcriptional regulator [Paracoccaceae bacterium]